MAEKKEAVLYLRGVSRATIRAAKEKARKAGIIWRAWVEQALVEKLERS